MPKPAPPCTPDCPRRSWVCHNREVCPDWGTYQDELAAWNAMIYAAKQEEDDLRTARRAELARQKWQKRKRS